jgi:hypothetical protein
MKKKNFCRLLRLIPLPLLAVPLFFASCSSDDSMTPIDEVTPPQRPISVEVSEAPFGNTTEARQLTRAAITDLTSFSSFKMTANNDLIPVEKKNGSWVVHGSWPYGVDDNTSVNFYAYSNGTYNDNSGTPYISFIMDENASAQHDLLVATNTVSFNDHQGKVPLTFDHACAAVAFNVQITNTLKTKKLSNGTLTVNSIVLRNVSNSGKYYFGTSTWGDVSGSAYYTLTSGNINVDTEAQALSSNYLFVIPQTRAVNGTTGTYLEINYTLSGSKQATIPLAVNWEAGKQYTINIKLGTTLIQ